MARMTTLTRALAGWEGVLKRVEDLYLTAETSSVIKPVKNLVPKALITDKSGKDNVRFISGSLAQNSNEIRDISAFSFVGGGSSITYVEDETVESSKSESNEQTKEGNDGRFFSTDTRLVFAAFDVKDTVGTGFFELINKGTGTGTSVTSTRSFTLSDPDVGDSFDVKVCSSHTPKRSLDYVQVFRDPVFQTPFFLTKSGRSKYEICFQHQINVMINHFRCFWEPNTARREGAMMLYQTGDGRMSQILPENAAVFEVCCVLLFYLPCDKLGRFLCKTSLKPKKKAIMFSVLIQAAILTDLLFMLVDSC
jgi:hypothetical protein